MASDPLDIHMLARSAGLPSAHDLTPGLFHRHAGVLRIELNPGYHGGRALYLALQRLEAIFQRACGPESASGIVVLKTPKRPDARLEALLNACGLEHPLNQRISVSPLTGPEGDAWQAHTFRAGPTFLDVMPYLWPCLAREQGIKPSAWIEPYVFVTPHNLLIAPYDDRGVDIVAADPTTLVPLCDHFEAWILADDLLRFRDGLC